MNHAAYGKTMENVRNRIDVKLVSNKNNNLKWTYKPSYMSHKIFDNDLVGIRNSKVTVTLNQPAYIGMRILELSKVLIYKFHYDYIKNKYDNKSKLLFKGTDSLMYEIKTEDVYEDFRHNKEMFDFSSYLSKSKYDDTSNKLVIGKMKDETGVLRLKNSVDWSQKCIHS